VTLPLLALVAAAPAALASNLPGAPFEPDRSGVGALEGVITSPIDGRGLSGVDVVVRHVVQRGAVEVDPWSSATRTDFTGAFHFEALPPGVYSLDVLGEVPAAAFQRGSPAQRASGPDRAPDRVWTQVAPIVVVAGSTAVEQVVLHASPVGGRAAPATPAPKTDT
jgi:hypothetical protein